MVSGPPGAGKSTLCGELVARFERSVLLQADWFFGRWRGGAIAPWLPDAEPQTGVAGRAAAAAAGEFARADCVVVYDGLVRWAETPALVAAAGPARVHYLALLPPLEVCLGRVASRSGHGFTDLPAAERMHGEFAGAPLPAPHVLAPTGREEADDVEGLVAEVLTRLAAGQLALAPRS